MRAERTFTSKHPIVVNDKLLDRLGALASEVYDEAIQRAADEYRVDKTELKQALSSQHAEGAELAVDYTADTGEVDKQIAAREHDRAIRRACGDVIRQSALSAHVTFDNDVTINVDGISELKTLLATEHDRPLSLSIRCGYSVQGSSFTLHIHNALTTYICSVYGDRRSVEYYSNSLRNILSSYTPDYYYFHLAKTQVVAGLCVGILTNVSSGYLINRIFNSPQTDSATAIVSALIAGILQLIVFFWVIKLLESTFPKCTFEYGNPWRKQRVRITMLGVLVTAVISPLIFELIF